MDIQSVLAQLDGMFARKELSQVEPLLLEALDQATREGDNASRLTLLNELVGYYRSISRNDDALKMAAAALGLIADMGLAGTKACATTLVNVATAYRAAGDLTRAARYYEDARVIYERLGEHGYGMASLLNNMSQVSQTLGRHAEAIPLLERALALLKTLNGVDAENATTHSNLALSLMALGQLDEAENHIREALAIFESTNGLRDAHYGAALAAAGELYSLRGDHAAAVRYYEQALPEIERSFGKNDGYQSTLRRLENERNKR